MKTTYDSWLRDQGLNRENLLNTYTYAGFIFRMYEEGAGFRGTAECLTTGNRIRSNWFLFRGLVTPNLKEKAKLMKFGDVWDTPHGRMLKSFTEILDSYDVEFRRETSWKGKPYIFIPGVQLTVMYWSKDECPYKVYTQVDDDRIEFKFESDVWLHLRYMIELRSM